MSYTRASSSALKAVSPAEAEPHDTQGLPVTELTQCAGPALLTCLEGPLTTWARVAFHSWGPVTAHTLDPCKPWNAWSFKQEGNSGAFSFYPSIYSVLGNVLSTAQLWRTDLSPPALGSHGKEASFSQNLKIILVTENLCQISHVHVQGHTNTEAWILHLQNCKESQISENQPVCC